MTFISPISRMRKLRLKEMMSIAQAFPAGKRSGRKQLRQVFQAAALRPFGPKLSLSGCLKAVSFPSTGDSPILVRKSPDWVNHWRV